MKEEEREHSVVQMKFKTTSIIDNLRLNLNCSEILKSNGIKIKISTETVIERGTVCRKQGLDEVPNTYHYEGATVTVGIGRYETLKTTVLRIVKPNGAISVQKKILEALKVRNIYYGYGNIGDYLSSYDD